MNQKAFGAVISGLRKKSGMTQTQLARVLNVSDKAISKWETGLGYPEITLLPKIAECFGVSVDYLFTGERRGITIAGNILTDIVKTIDSYPKVGMLAKISTVSRSVGGCVPNTAIDLAKIDRTIPISAVGCVGDDEYGRYVISQLRRRNIDTGRIVVSASAPTSFSDVMSMPTGERTFFHARGANAEFSPSQVDIPGLGCAILHTGYILLLDHFDAPDPEYGTVMARFLHDVQSQGIKTSIDMVSDSTADYSDKVIPALKYCNYVIVNEIECCGTWKLQPRRPDGSLDLSAIRLAMERMLEAGVEEKVIVHSKEAGMCLSRDSGFTVVPSLRIPSSRIKGSVGAGDAFCAGCLFGIYNKMSDRQILEFASASAACSLFSENAVDGMRGKDDIFAMAQNCRRMAVPK